MKYPKKFDVALLNDYTGLRCLYQRDKRNKTQKGYMIYDKKSYILDFVRGS